MNGITERIDDEPEKGQKKTARTSQKEEEVGELPRATEVTGGRRSFQILKPPLTRPLD